MPNDLLLLKETVAKGPKKLITIRLQKSLLDDLKNLAKLRGVRYQTLINQVITKWIDERV